MLACAAFAGSCNFDNAGLGTKKAKVDDQLSFRLRFTWRSVQACELNAHVELIRELASLNVCAAAKCETCAHLSAPVKNYAAAVAVPRPCHPGVAVMRHCVNSLNWFQSAFRRSPQHFVCIRNVQGLTSTLRVMKRMKRRASCS